MKMNKEKYIYPEYLVWEFHCPHCQVYANQNWSLIETSNRRITNHYKRRNNKIEDFEEEISQDRMISKCGHCKDLTFWFEENIVYPKNIPVTQSNEDLDDDIKKDYMEASIIFNDSPRASAALLRLALQKLCKQLWEKGENINDDIWELVKKWLSPMIQKSLDSLRIVWNNAVHPWEINLDEDRSKVLKLFELINFIADKMITEPKEIDNFYDETLPESSKVAIEKRDS